MLGRAAGQLGWARYHRATGNAARARASASDALALAADPDQPLVRMVGHRLLGEIETEVGRHAEAETHLTTALDLGSDLRRALRTSADAPGAR